MQIYYLMLYFFVYGFLGWCTEVAYATTKQRKFVSRGFLNGPICPIYGVGVTVVVYFLTPYKDNLILLYALSTVLVTVLEGLTGYLMDKIFHHKWWDYTNQPPELWDQFKTDFPKGNHIRIHPLLQWNELDIWEYIKRENIPIIDLYFAKDGERYRSLGCAPCTGKIKSDADTLDKIIEELKHTTTGERAGRAQDQEDAYAMQKLRKDGYM